MLWDGIECGMCLSLSGEGLSSLSKWACPWLRSQVGACSASAIGRVFLTVLTTGNSRGTDRDWETKNAIRHLCAHTRSYVSEHLIFRNERDVMFQKEKYKILYLHKMQKLFLKQYLGKQMPVV